MARFGQIDSPGGGRRGAVLRLVAALLLLACVAPSLAPSGPFVSAQEADPACKTSEAKGGAYSVTICLEIEGEVSGLEGDSRVTATVETSGDNVPAINQVGFELTKLPANTGFDILSDYAAPYTFLLPTHRFSDGSYLINANVAFADMFSSAEASLPAVFANGVGREPAVTDTWEPTSGRPGNDFVVAAVGDGAGGLPGADAVSDLIKGWDPNLLLYLGDVYNSGTYTEFHNYYEPTLGDLKAVTNPVPGNHEAGGSGFKGYHEYWDTETHYYSVKAAGWHLIGLDNTEIYGQLAPGSAQYEWLRQDLAANANECTIVFFHYPRWGLGRTTDYQENQAFWELFADHGVEMVLAGHEHNYHRWQPMDRTGAVNPEGITQIVIGTGGHELEGLQASDPRVVSAIEGRDGALRLVLSNTGAEYQFMATDGAVLDSGAIPCTVPGVVTLGKTKSKPAGEVQVELSKFAPESEITLRWADGTELATAQADGDGHAVASFRTPTVAYGTYQITAEDDTGLTGEAYLAVIPRVKLADRSIAAGSDLSIDVSGFNPATPVEIRWFEDADGDSYEVLSTVTTGADGGGSVVVAIPPSASPGEHKLVAAAASGQRMSGSATIRVTAPEASPVADG